MPKNSESFGARLKLENPAHILGFLLKSLQHTLAPDGSTKPLRKQGVELSFAQFSALFNLHCDPGVTGAQLARRAMVSAQTMNSALRALELDGYIERRPHPSSRRADSWSLTNAGSRGARARAASRLGDLRANARRLRRRRRSRRSKTICAAASRRSAAIPLPCAGAGRRPPRPASAAPERRRQQHEKRVDLEAAEQHRDREHDLAVRRSRPRT